MSLVGEKGRRGRECRGGGVEADQSRRKGPGTEGEQRNKGTIRTERERRIQEETILDCKQGVTETGEKVLAADLRGRGGGE